MEKKKETKPVEFSKLLMIYAMSMNTIVIFFTLFIVWATGHKGEWSTYDLVPLQYLIPAVAAEVASGSAFYYWKAKAENRLKIAISNNVPITENSIYSILN